MPADGVVQLAPAPATLILHAGIDEHEDQPAVGIVSAAAAAAAKAQVEAQAGGTERMTSSNDDVIARVRDEGNGGTPSASQGAERGILSFQPI